MVKGVYYRRELAHLLGCGVETIDKWIKEGLIKVLYKGTHKNSKILIDGYSVRDLLGEGAL